MASNVLNWNECVFCQEVTSDKLQKPQDNPRTKDGGEAAYRSLSDILINLRDSGCHDELPEFITVNSTSNTVFETLQSNSA